MAVTVQAIDEAVDTHVEDFKRADRFLIDLIFFAMLVHLTTVIDE